MTYTNPISTFFHKLHGSTIIARNFFGQQRIPYLPLEQQQAMRDKRIRNLVRYAAETVPYYRNLFAAEKINPAHIQTAADLVKLPILDKDLLRRHPEQFVSSAVKGQPQYAARTSGTTGLPLQLYHDRESVLANSAFSERERLALFNMIKPGILKSYLEINPRTSTVGRVKNFVRENALVIDRLPGKMIFLTDPFEKIISEINESKPDILGSQGSYIELLFRTVKARRIPMHRPKLVFYFADGITESGQQLIQQEFGIPLFTVYNANEFFKIAFSCEKQNGMHVHVDLAHVRVVNDHGQDAAMGEVGDIVISNLVNRATVLLNYRIGDRGSLSDEPCTCGRTTPRLVKLEGRSEDIVTLPNGEFLHPRIIWMALRDYNGIMQYQVVQTALDHYELKLAMESQAAFDEQSAAIVARVQPLFGESIKITPVFQETLHIYGAQKFRSVISLSSREKLGEANQFTQAGGS